MSIIHVLPDQVANKIAAGEVVERPASVVKELIENSLDAEASRINVSVEAGGKRLIRVEDNGCGMSHDDALLAFERHATSKIRTSDDLFEIATLGFRGEALPSIAAVTRLVLETRHASEAAGTRVEIAGGKLRDVKELAWPGGTRVEARDLFFNTPARRKFLKSESTELGHIASLATHYALAHPEKSFRLASLSNEIINVSPVADFRSRVYQLMGAQTLEQLVEIAPVERLMPAAPVFGPEDEPPEPPPPSRVKIFGFVSRPEIQRLNRDQIYFFVNRRLVRDRLILHAITEAYRHILPPRMFPVALLFFELPPAEVDVNVHPSKTEVRFRHSGFMHDFARDAIRQALVAARPVAAFPASRSSARAQEDSEVEFEERLDETPPAPGASGFPSSAANRPQVHGERARAAPAAFQLASPTPALVTGRLPLSEPLRSLPLPAQGQAHVPSPGVPPFPSGPSAAAAEWAAPRPAGAEFPADLRPLGQVEDSFIVATNAEGLWIIDQHVAHERVLFERQLRLTRERRAESQRLLLPIVVELKPAQQVVFSEIAGELGASGFDAEPFGQRTVAVKAAPSDIRAEDVDRLLVEIVESVAAEGRALSIEVLRSKISASVACHAAIKINTPLGRDKMLWLLKELGKTECPMTCPHGRPIMLKYSLKEIQKAFKRL